MFLTTENKLIMLFFCAVLEKHLKVVYTLFRKLSPSNSIMVAACDSAHLGAEILLSSVVGRGTGGRNGCRVQMDTPLIPTGIFSWYFKQQHQM
jgi:hypothetical protein